MEEIQVIKEKNEKIEIYRPLRKTVLLCTNGFQTTDTHDSLPMKEYFENTFKEECPQCEVALVKLFEPGDKKTHHKQCFERQLDKAIREYIDKGYNIYLLGYSFSAALVCKMARKYQKYVLRVILVAPVYDTIINHMLPGYCKYAYKFHKLNKKYGKKVSKAIGRQTVKGLPGLLLAIFDSILANRKYFRKVTQPTLLIRGTEDILCTSHAIKKVSGKIKGENELYLYPKMSHGILKSVRLNGIVYEDILNFAFDTSFHLENNVQIVAKKNIAEEKETRKLDDDGYVIPTFSEIFIQIDPEGDDYSVQSENEF
jgi:esterase/lipase